MLLSFGGVSFHKRGAGIAVTNLAEEIRTFDVEVVTFVKVLLCRGLKIFHEQDTSTGNHNVDFAEFVHSLGNHTLNVLDAASITFDE